MDAESYILKLNQGLDEIVTREFDFTRCGELLPNAKELTLSARLEVARNLHLDRPEFSRRVDIEVATTWEANEELAAVTAAKESLVRTLVDEEQTRRKLIGMAKDRIASLGSDFSFFEIRDQLLSDLDSNDRSREVEAIGHIPLLADNYAQCIRDELQRLELTSLEIRRSQIAGSVESYQNAKSDLAATWMSLVAVVTLHYCRGLPVRDLFISGMSGLAKGIEKFEPKREFEFGRYSRWWIMQGITMATLELRGVTYRELELGIEIKNLIGPEKWPQWIQAPNPADVSELGLADEVVLEVVRKCYVDKEIHPRYCKGKHLTPDCVGAPRKWVELSENITAETNPLWWF